MIETDIFPPGSRLGILGSGQLGRMLAIEAKRLGYTVVVFSPDKNTPAGQVSDVEIVGDYRDEEALAGFAAQVDVVTLEFENIAVEALDFLGQSVPVYPQRDILYTTQNRVREKQWLQAQGIPVTDFHPVRTLDDLHAGIARVGLPAVLKTAGWGYDGKGQFRIETQQDAARAFEGLNGEEGILEQWVSDLSQELSVIVARGGDGEIAIYGPVENEHKNHILDISRVPALIGGHVSRYAIQTARAIAETFDLRGVLCVEFFLTREHRLLVNELAPRPHNSGHYSIEACVTSQFEQQLRAVCGLPLGSAEQLKPAAMVNLLGDLWENGEPDWPAAMAVEDAWLHLYGKAAPKPGRKMGHITSIGYSVGAALRHVMEARRRLSADKP